MMKFSPKKLLFLVVAAALFFNLVLLKYRTNQCEQAVHDLKTGLALCQRNIVWYGGQKDLDVELAIARRKIIGLAAGEQLLIQAFQKPQEDSDITESSAEVFSIRYMPERSNSCSKDQSYQIYVPAKTNLVLRSNIATKSIDFTGEDERKFVEFDKADSREFRLPHGKSIVTVRFQPFEDTGQRKILGHIYLLVNDECISTRAIRSNEVEFVRFAFSPPKYLKESQVVAVKDMPIVENFSVTNSYQTLSLYIDSVQPVSKAWQ